MRQRGSGSGGREGQGRGEGEYKVGGTEGARGGREEAMM